MLKVLLVDDEPFVRQGMRLIIDWSSNGFEICGEASNVKEAIERLSERSFDVVFVDLVMPQVNGMELVKHIRNNCPPDVFVVIVTGHFEHSYVKAAFEYGLTQYLLKPIQPDELLKVLKQISQTNAQRRAETDKRSHILDAQLHMELEKLASCRDNAAISETLNRMLPSESPYVCLSIECVNTAPLLEFCKRERIYVVNMFSDRAGTGVNILVFMIGKRQSGEDLCETADAILKLYTTADEKITIRMGKETKGIEHLSTAVQCARDSSIYGTGDSKELLLRIANYIQIHYRERLTLNSLSSIFFINAAYLGQLFKQTYGVYLKEYLYSVRVEKAQQLLSEQNISIREAAERTGFQDANQFIKYFTKEYGITPGKYRKEQNNNE